MVRSGISAFLLSLLAASSLAQLPLPQGLEFEVYPFGEPGIGVTSRIVAEDRSEFLLLGQELGDDGRTLTATGRFYGGDGFPVAEPVVFEGFTGCAPFGVSGLLTEERVLFVWTPLPPFVPGGGTGPPCSQETPRAVRAQWFSRQGAPEGEAFQVSTTEEGERYYPSAAMLSDGSLLISWAQVGPERSGDEFDFYILSRQLGRRFSAAGESLGPELNFRVNQDFESEGGRSVVVPDAGDSFLLIWEYDGGEGTFGEVA